MSTSRRRITQSATNRARKQGRSPADTGRRLDAVERAISGLLHLAGGSAVVSQAADEATTVRREGIVAGLVAAGRLAAAPEVGTATAIIVGAESAPSGEVLGRAVHLQTHALRPDMARAFMGAKIGDAVRAEGTSNTFTISGIYDAVPAGEASA